MKEIVYQKQEYVVWKANGGYVVYNTLKPFKSGHTHLKSKKRVVEVIDNSIDYHFPLHWSNYFIISMIRLTTNERFKCKLEHLHQTRLGKSRRLYK